MEYEWKHEIQWTWDQQRANGEVKGCLANLRASQATLFFKQLKIDQIVSRLAVLLMKMGGNDVYSHC